VRCDRFSCAEQTLYCELDAPQRRLYDQLRDHYRAPPLKRVQTGGIGRAKMQILEARTSRCL
jgi:hypothetical protein